MRFTKLGLVLGGGGALGWVYHAGVLAALADRGIEVADIDLVVGTSAGAAVAASARAGASARAIVEMMAVGPTSEQREQLLADVRSAPKSLRPLSPGLARQAVRARSNPVMALAGILPRGWFPTGFADRFPGIPDLGAWPDGLWIPAVRALDGQLEVFGRERHDVSVSDAVAASSAVPGMFQPKRLGGVDYIDGGVVSPTHADLLIGTEVDRVVVSSPMTRPSRRYLARHARRRLAIEVTLLEQAGKEVLVVQPSERLVEVATGFPRSRPEAAFAIAEQAEHDVEAACAAAGIGSVP